MENPGNLHYGASLRKNITDLRGFTVVEMTVSAALLVIVLLAVLNLFSSLGGTNTLGKRIDLNEQGRMLLLRLGDELTFAKKIVSPSSWWDGNYQVKDISFLDRNFKRINYSIRNSKVYRWVGDSTFSEAGRKKREVLSGVSDQGYQSYFHLAGKKKFEICLKLNRKKQKTDEKIRHMKLATVIFLRGLMG